MKPISWRNNRLVRTKLPLGRNSRAGFADTGGLGLYRSGEHAEESVQRSTETGGVQQNREEGKEK